MRNGFRAILTGLSRTLWILGGVSFFFGGRALAEFAHTDRLTGEFIGIAAAVLLLALGGWLNSIAEDLEIFQSQDAAESK